MSNKNTLLGRKQRRIKAQVEDDLYETDLSMKIENSKNMYDDFVKYKSNNSDIKNFEKLDKIIEINEINPTYNYEFLKLQKKLDIKSKGNYSYFDNFKQLGVTLPYDKYYELTGNSQQNPSNELYELLNLYLKSPTLFDEKTAKIKRILYNIPLVESVERVRMNYYISLLQNYSSKLTKKESDFLKEKRLPKTNDEINATKLYKEYEAIKNGINKFSEIIQKSKDFFKEIDLDKFDFNFKIYLFILYVTKIIDYVDEQSGKDLFIINLYKKEFGVVDELKELPIKDDNHIYKNNTIGIMKTNEEKDEYLIYNTYEKIYFNGKNYVISNLIKDFDEHRLTPINYILERNKTLKYFFETNLNFINDNDIYPELLIYFKTFIKSKCVEQFFDKYNQYEKIKNLIKNDSIIDEFLNSKYLKSAPLFDFGPIGFTNKDLMIYLIIGIPLLIENYKIKNYEEYQNIKNLIFLFNVGMKFIILLHEFLIHILYGYLYHISDKHISSESPKKSNKRFECGGFLFEELFFGRKIGEISIQEVITVLNGDCLDSFEKFKEQFKKDFEGINPKSKLLKNILKKYPVELDLNFPVRIIGNMKSSFNSIIMKRNLSNVLPPFSNDN